MRSLAEIKASFGKSPIVGTIQAEGDDGMSVIIMDLRLHGGNDGALFDVIASWGGRWDHVSTKMLVPGETDADTIIRTPTWDEMCFIKDIFWGENECVMQLHPPKKDYVNTHPHVLHLWRPQNRAIPRPPKIFV